MARRSDVIHWSGRALAAVLLFAVAGACAAEAAETEAQAGGDAWGALVAKLEAEGFGVQEGSAGPFDLSKLYCTDPHVKSGNYNNYGAPYVAFSVPSGPAQTSPTPAPWLFRLRPDEAIVVVGRTPPSARYFSYTPWVFVKSYPSAQGGPPELIRAWDSLGDSINDATLRTTGSEPFDWPLFLISTPDEGVDARIRRAAQAAGYPPTSFNTLQIPSAVLSLGLGDANDVLTLGARTALFTDDAAGEAYVAHPPLRVLRVTPRKQGALVPYAAPVLRIRGTGRTELDRTPDLQRLRAAILQRFKDHQATEYVTNPILYEGTSYLQRRADAFGDTRDALYLGAGWLPGISPTDADRFSLGDGDFLVAYGVNHVAEGKATYQNVNVYASEAQLGIASLFDRDFGGGARALLGRDDPAAKSLYAVQISRRCNFGSLVCLQVNAPESCPRVTVDASTILGVVFRVYLEPVTKVGPAVNELVYDRIIRFSRKRG
jgi:hypothetical protein